MWPARAFGLGVRVNLWLRSLNDDVGLLGNGAPGAECAEARRGATARVVSEIGERLQPSRYRQAMPWFAILWALARLWNGRMASRREPLYGSGNWMCR